MFFYVCFCDQKRHLIKALLYLKTVLYKEFNSHQSLITILQINLGWRRAGLDLKKVSRSCRGASQCIRDSLWLRLRRQCWRVGRTKEVFGKVVQVTNVIICTAQILYKAMTALEEP